MVPAHAAFLALLLALAQVRSAFARCIDPQELSIVVVGAPD
jgi:hypothetical protein